MKLLEPRDFELLVDLVFSTSGWRRRKDPKESQSRRARALTLIPKDDTAAQEA